MKKFVLTSALLLLASSPFVTLGQDPAKAPAAKAADKPTEKKVEAKAANDKKADSKMDEKKSTNRLPSNYGKLGLSEAQRSKIYTVQDQHETEIDALSDKLKAAKANRDTEIEAILTPEQKKTLKDLNSAKKAPTPGKEENADVKEKK